MSHDLHSDVGAYVADALDDAEREAFEAHLPGCAACQQEVGEFRETVARLTVVSETAPPPALRASVLAAIREVRPQPPEVDDTSAPVVGVTTPPVAAAAGRGLPEDHEDAGAPLDELARRRQRRVTRLLTGLVAAAVVVALALGGWAMTLQQRVGTVVAESAVRTELLSAPDVEAVSVPLPDGGGHVGYTLSREQDRAILSAAALAETQPGKVYQLWTMELDAAGAPVPESIEPNATFTGGEDLSVLFDHVRDTEALAITVEDAPRATTPSTETLFGLAPV